MARIRVGVTAWADRGLIASGWYPPSVSTAEARLRHYATRFSLVENDSSYWALPDRRQVELWSERTPDDFVMNMKAHALLTGHYTAPKRLPAKLREQLPAELRAADKIYARQLPLSLMDDVAAWFHDALAPLHERGKLGAVLFQFPVWFPISRENRHELVRIKRRFSPYRIAVELRNRTWMSARNRPETLEWLAEAGLAYVCVDEPQGFVSSVPPIAAATARDLSLVRLHGRNANRWMREARSAAERFDYLYPRDELETWVPKIDALARQTREVHVLFNNCHADYAVKNAQQMVELLAPLEGKRDVRAPGATL
jgi:uncharacterized protein YecE (DUF72 family)